MCACDISCDHRWRPRRVRSGLGGGPGAAAVCQLVAGIDHGGAGLKLYLRHGQHRAARAFEHVVGQWVVQERRAVALQLDLTAHGAFMKAVAHQRQHHIGIRVLAVQRRLLVAKAGQVGAEKHRVQRRHFQLEADGAVHRLGV